MKDLKAIVKSLSKKELKFITDYYKNNNEKRRLVLFKGVLSKKFDTDEQAAIKIYGKKCSAYSHLKGRLKEDLMNLLLFFMHEVEHSSAVMQAEIDVDRMLMQAKLLHRRKATDLAIKLLKKCYDLCNEFELIKEKVIVTFWYANISGMKNGIGQFKEIQKNNLVDVKLLSDYLLSYYYMNELLITNKFSKNAKQKYLKVINRTYSELKILHNRNVSPNITHNFYNSAIEYYSHNKDYDKLLLVSRNLNKLVIGNKELNSVTREANSFLQLFNAAIQLLKYKLASKYAINALEVIKKSRLKNSANELLVLEYIYLSTLRENNLKYLKTVLNNGLNHPSNKQSIKIKEKWLFFNASYLFKLKDYNKTLETLYLIKELLQDKSGWLFTFKLLEIMCYIEQEEFDMVNYRIETFRKLLSKKENNNFDRIKTIHQVLKSLLKYGFNFKKVAIKEKLKLALLTKSEDEFYWNPLGFEIIRFDEWFYEHLE